MRKGRREVTWKMSKTDMANQIDDTSGRMVQLACVVAVDLLISQSWSTYSRRSLPEVRKGAGAAELCGVSAWFRSTSTRRSVTCG